MDILAYSAVELAQAIKAGENTAVEAMKAGLMHPRNPFMPM